MTDRVRARNSATMTAGGWHRLVRVAFPLCVVTSAIFAAGVLQSARVAAATPEPVSHRPVAVAAPAAPTQSPLPGLGQEDLSLSMVALGGLAQPDAASVHVLPAGNAPSGPDTVGPRAIGSTTVIQWLKTAVPTTLWMGQGAEASAFTDIPAGSFLRVVGASDRGRVPVYYPGDGALHRSGHAWVEATAVAAVDAPPPGQVVAVDADARKPLDVWLQAHRATILWSGPDDKAIILTDLPQWTFVKAAGLERGGRLLVNYAGDYATRQPGVGWVDSAAVGPAGDPGVWVTNHRVSTLWSGTDGGAVKFNDLPQWTKLRIVAQAMIDSNRVQVQFFGDGVTRVPGVAWIARADIGPITPPYPLPAITPVGTAPTPLQKDSYSFASGTEFINAVGASARRSSLLSHVPASVTVAQAILESDWGRSRLTRQGNNLFGIKALGSVTGPAGTVTLSTWEHVDDSDVVVQAPFKAYFTLEQSIDDHARFLTGNRRYRGAMDLASDARAFARAIQDAGYATDPDYAAKLIALMNRYDLYRFDS